MPIFFALRAVEAFYYFESRTSHKSLLTGAIIVYILWTTAFLVGIWFRQNWARYGLLIFLLIGVVAEVFLVLTLAVQTDTVNQTMLVPLTGVSIKAAIIWFLVTSEDIRRLVRHTHY